MNKPGSRLLYPPASARNMVLLVQLRWMAVVGQLLTIWIAARFMGIGLPLAQLVSVPVLLAIVNLSTQVMGRERQGYTYVELLGALMLDVLALTWQLHFSGGVTNPFTFLFLLQIVIGAILLPPDWSWIVAAIAVLCVVLLSFDYQPLALPPVHAGAPLDLYLTGSFVCFLLIAVLLVFFVIRIDRNRRQSDTALAKLRQQAAEEDHIVRMGLLASGAAHELGTPLSTMSVLVRDWLRHPAIAADTDMAAELADMETELQRCKSIVSGILLSAGEARGENPTITRLDTFVRDIAREWAARSNGAVALRNRIDSDLSIVSDPALRQVIGNVVDNALEVSPAEVWIEASLADSELVIEVTDRGPGFTAEMLDTFGRPYASTKGRPGGGLGLFLVVNVLRKLGGRVTVANRPHGGALVRLTIPLAALAVPERKREGTS
ncbi:ATP-binding protein [Novosphingobium sp. FKTRR1]|uniref:ATP-binding protein n=1 Tax=unclassified Novosphingobium TaxID=2644732 RepID=UPI001CF0CBB2|nr:ATP-binding protein [Novosphingobium sp. FKTRR1]